MKTLGLDIGTTSISAVVYDTESGVLTAKSVQNGSFLPSHGWERLQDPGVIFGKATALITQLLEIHPEVQALGVTGQMHGILYLDGNGE